MLLKSSAYPMFEGAAMGEEEKEKLYETLDKNKELIYSLLFGENEKDKEEKKHLNLSYIEDGGTDVRDIFRFIDSKSTERKKFISTSKELIKFLEYMDNFERKNLQENIANIEKGIDTAPKYEDFKIKGKAGRAKTVRIQSTYREKLSILNKEIVEFRQAVKFFEQPQLPKGAEKAKDQKEKLANAEEKFDRLLGIATKKLDNKITFDYNGESKTARLQDAKKLLSKDKKTLSKLKPNEKIKKLVMFFNKLIQIISREEDTDDTKELLTSMLEAYEENDFTVYENMLEKLDSKRFFNKENVGMFVKFFKNPKGSRLKRDIKEVFFKEGSTDIDEEKVENFKQILNESQLISVADTQDVKQKFEQLISSSQEEYINKLQQAMKNPKKFYDIMGRDMKVVGEKGKGARIRGTKNVRWKETMEIQMYELADDLLDMADMIEENRDKKPDYELDKKEIEFVKEQIEAFEFMINVLYTIDYDVRDYTKVSEALEVVGYLLNDEDSEIDIETYEPKKVALPKPKTTDKEMTQINMLKRLKREILRELPKPVSKPSKMQSRFNTLDEKTNANYLNEVLERIKEDGDFKKKQIEMERETNKIKTQLNKLVDRDGSIKPENKKEVEKLRKQIKLISKKFYDSYARGFGKAIKEVKVDIKNNIEERKRYLSSTDGKSKINALNNRLNEIKEAEEPERFESKYAEFIDFIEELKDIDKDVLTSLDEISNDLDSGELTPQELLERLGG